ncbi:hypothetical protein [Mucilaginibacter sp.]|uniref:hypothetical protein n=1 Tax=Mucilaginibacter sp. TaxID=1882438 RepID=UPI0035BC22CD
MESTLSGFDRANGQGANHDIKGNVENAGNETVKRESGDENENNDLAKEIPTVTPENDTPLPENGDAAPNSETTVPENNTPELENPTDQSPSNKGQGPAGENL